MPNSPTRRTDSGSRFIEATPETIYQALLDPKAIVAWRPPEGMRAEVHAFEPRVGGSFRMSFIYLDADARGKTAEHADIFEGCFLELVPKERMVERIEFESDDPAFSGAMVVTTFLMPSSGGTVVTIVCDNVPDGISQADHELGIASTLANLATYAEAR